MGFLSRLLGCFILFFCGALPESTEPLRVQEVIKGIKGKHKKELYRYSAYAPYATCMGLPIRKWLYIWGKKYHAPKAIAQEIAQLNKELQVLSASPNKDQKRIAKYKRQLNHKQRLLEQGNRLMRMGEKPRYYHATSLKKNKQIFLSYLRAHGYIAAHINHEIKWLKNRAKITYHIEPHGAYTIRNKQMIAGDQTIHGLLLAHQHESHIQVGKVYRYQDCVNEQERIITLLSNHGYFDFNQDAIHFKAHTNHDTATIDITTLIENEKTATGYTQATIQKVVVDLSQHLAHNREPKLVYVAHKGIYFILPSNHYSTKKIAEKIQIRPGDLYNKSKILDTYEQLQATLMFESINILPKIEGREIVAYIYAKPYARVNFEVEFGGEGMAKKDDHRLTQFSWSPILKLTPTIRRLFKGINTTQVQGAISSNRSEITGKNIQSYELNYKLSTPQFIFFLPSKIHQCLERFRPNTVIHLGYSYKGTKKNSTIDAAWQYHWHSPNKTIAYEGIPFKVSIGQTQSRDSFLSSLSYGTIFKNTPHTLLFSHHVQPDQWICSLALEWGGFYEHICMLKKVLPSYFQLYHYLKFDLAYHHTFHYTPHTMLVYQTKLGVALPYPGGKNSSAVHPDRQYEVGGYNSIRGWKVATIGPGAHISKQGEEAKGDMVLLANIEARQKLLGYLEAAFFLDVGNVWKISAQAPTEMQFSLNRFYHQLAMGMGVGLRLNFKNIFVLCVDVASKVVQPNGSKIHPSERFALHFNIGYPF